MLRHAPGLPASPRMRYILSTPGEIGSLPGAPTPDEEKAPHAGAF